MLKLIRLPVLNKEIYGMSDSYAFTSVICYNKIVLKS